MKVLEHEGLPALFARHIGRVTEQHGQFAIGVDHAAVDRLVVKVEHIEHAGHGLGDPRAQVLALGQIALHLAHLRDVVPHHEDLGRSILSIPQEDAIAEEQIVPFTGVVADPQIDGQRFVIRQVRDRAERPLKKRLIVRVDALADEFGHAQSGSGCGYMIEQPCVDAVRIDSHLAGHVDDKDLARDCAGQLCDESLAGLDLELGAFALRDVQVLADELPWRSVVAQDRAQGKSKPDLATTDAVEPIIEGPRFGVG